MKKFLSTIGIFVLCVYFAFAQEGEAAAVPAAAEKPVESKPAVEASTVQQPIVRGSTTVQWGIDFGAGIDTNIKAKGDAVPKHGFYNTNNISVLLPFAMAAELSGGSKDKDAAVYATIDISAFGIAAGNGGGVKAAPKGFAANIRDINAKLVFYGAYITVYDKPNFEINYAQLWAPISANPAGAFGGDFAPSFTGWGTKIGYASAKNMKFDLGIKFGSNGNWNSVPSDPSFDKKSGKHDSRYGFGFDLSMEPVEKYLSFDFSLNGIIRSFDKTDGAGIEGYTDWGYNVGISDDFKGSKKKYFLSVGSEVSSEPVEGMKIYAGFDGAANHKYQAVVNGKKKDGWDFAWDVGLGFSYKWFDTAIYATSKGTALHGWNDAADIPDTANMALHLGISTDDGNEDTQLIKGFSAHASLNLYDLLVKKASNLESPENIKTELLKYNLQIDEGTVDYASLQEDLSGWGIRQLPIGLNLGLAYKVNINDSMWLKPYAEFYGETNHIGYHKSLHEHNVNKLIAKPYFGAAYELGLTFSPIEKVEIDMNWAHGKLNSNKYEGGFNGNYMIEKPVNYRMHNGTFILSMRIKY